MALYHWLAQYNTHLQLANFPDKRKMTEHEYADKMNNICGHVLMFRSFICSQVLLIYTDYSDIRHRQCTLTRGVRMKAAERPYILYFYLLC